jgi:heterodisulfide reductase subunit D
MEDKKGKPFDFMEGLTKKELIELDACTRCNECLNWCPVQDVTKDPSISPPARIHAYKAFVEQKHTLKGKLFSSEEVGDEEMEKFKDALWKCALCGTCGEVCTVGIDGKKLWWSLRRKFAESKLGCPEALEKGPLENYRKLRNPFPFPLDNKYKIWWPDGIEMADKAEIGYYEGCGCAWDSPQMAEGAVKLLSAAGPFTMLDPDKSWCCGFPQVAGSGEWSVVVELVNHMAKAITDKGIKRLAISCPMCLDMIKYLWPYFYGDELPFEPMTIAELLAEFVEEGKLKFTKKVEETVTYHDPCAMARPFMGKPIIDEPRKLLEAVPGMKLVNMDRHGKLSRCCGGSAGTRVVSSDISAKIAKELFLEAKRTGAETMLTNCPVCYLNLGVRTHAAPNPVVEEWRRYEDPLKINDLTQYLAALL